MVEKSISGSGREEPPRDFKSSTKDNSDFKWKVDRSVVGALEVFTDPDLGLKAELIEHKIVGYDDEFQEYLKVWKDLKLKKEFITAFESIPPTTSCCGLITMQDQTIKHIVPLLNKGWVKSVNEKVHDSGFKISIFVWKWSNLTGKSETVIPLIRFHRLSGSKKK
jgi:hypothetical protein